MDTSGVRAVVASGVDGNRQAVFLILNPFSTAPTIFGDKLVREADKLGG